MTNRKSCQTVLRPADNKLRILDDAALQHDGNFYYDFLDGRIDVYENEGDFKADLILNIGMPSINDLVRLINKYKSQYAQYYDQDNFYFTFAMGHTIFGWLSKPVYDSVSASPADFYHTFENALTYDISMTNFYKMHIAYHLNPNFSSRVTEHILTFEPITSGSGATKDNLIEAVRRYAAYFFWLGMAFADSDLKNQLLLHNGADYFSSLDGIEDPKLPGGIQILDLRNFNGDSIVLSSDMISTIDDAKKK
jgi:hypothetical protein